MFTHSDLCRPDDFDAKKSEHVRAVQLKMNGIRIMVSVFNVSGQQSIRAITREGKTDYWPQLSGISHIRERIESLPDGTVLDSELHVPGMAETSVKTLIIAGDSQLQLNPFAVPWFGGEDMRLVELSTINKLITTLGFEHPETRYVEGAFTQQHVDLLLEEARSRSIEGWVLKAAHYQGWWKLKPVKTVDCVVVKVHMGEGKHRYRMGALEISLYDEHGVLGHPRGLAGDDASGWLCNVGTGFTDFERTAIWANKESVIGKVVEVAYDSLAANGALKFPRFLRFRDDKEAKQCTTAQI